jgi:hypothetical protein
MDQYDFLNNFHIKLFFKNTPFNSLKSVRGTRERGAGNTEQKNTALRHTLTPQSTPHAYIDAHVKHIIIF